MALPQAWTNVELFILEDRIGRLYLFDPREDHLERLDDRDANLLVQWYEFSQSYTWHARAELGRMLVSTDSQRQDMSPSKTRRHRRCSTLPVETLLHELIDDYVASAER